MTAVTPDELRTFHRLRASAPFHGSMPFQRVSPVTDVAGILDWLGSYLRHLDAQVAKVRGEDLVRARAAVVLRGLRMDLTNAVSTLEELDAAVEAGTLPVVTRMDAIDE